MQTVSWSCGPATVAGFPRFASPANFVTKEKVMISRSSMTLLVAAVSSVFATLPAHADLIQTTFGAMNGTETLAAHVDVTFSNDTITMVISNDTADIHAAGQLVVGLRFTLTTGQTSGTIASSSGTPLDVNNDDTFTLGTTGTIPDWSLSYGSGYFSLSDTGNDYTIIGGPEFFTQLYSNANASIHSHNPFLASPATFVLSVPGVTPDTHIDSATILVGTNYTEASTEIVPDVGTGTPEPASLALLAPVALLLTQRRLRKA